MQYRKVSLLILITLFLNITLNADIIDEAKLEYEKVNFKKAYILYKKACDSGNLNGCHKLGFMYQYAYGIAKNIQVAKDLYTKACNGGNINSCSSLGDLYQYGELGTKNDTEAEKLYRIVINSYNKDCIDGNYEKCYKLGDMYRLGKGVRSDRKKANKKFEVACDSGYYKGCFKSAVFYRVYGDKTKANKLFIRACKGGYLKACRKMGTLYLKGDSVEKNIKKATEFFEKDCINTEPKRCSGYVMLGDYYLKSQDIKEAISYYKIACDNENSKGCHKLGDMYLNKDGVKKDIEVAIMYYKKACENRYDRGCLELGNLYSSSKDIQQDDKKAIEYYTKACAGEVSEGCIKARNILAKNTADEKSKRLIAEFKSEFIRINEKECKRVKLHFKLEIHNILNDIERLKQACECKDDKACLRLKTLINSKKSY